jgi:CBS domain-containing protein
MNIASILATKGDKVVTIRGEQTIREALGVLARAAVKNEAIFALLVSGLMTRDVTVGSPGDDLQAVAATMVQRHFRHLPVVDGGKLVGMLSIGDVVKAQRDRYQGEVDTLQTIVMEGGH